LNSKLKSAIKLIVFLSIGLFILYFLYNNLEAAYQKECALNNVPSEECSFKDKVINDFKSVKLIWIVIISIFFMLSNLLRALRWNQFLDTMNYKPSVTNSLGAIMVAYLANLAIPRIGEVIRAGTLAKNEKIPVEKVMGTIVLDRLLDVISLLICIGLAFIFAFQTFKDYNEEHGMMNAQLLYILIGIGVAGLIGLLLLNKFLSQSTSQNPIVKKLQSLWIGFRDGLISVKNVKNFPLLIFYSVGIWVCYYLMTYLCFFAFAPTAHLGPIAGFVAFVFGSLGIVFPAPGGIGSYQYLVSQALILYGVNIFDAFSFSNIVFISINIIGNILFGFFFFFYLPIYNRKRLQQS